MMQKPPPPAPRREMRGIEPRVLAVVAAGLWVVGWFAAGVLLGFR